MMRPIKTTSRSKPPAAAGSSLIGRCPRRGGRAFYHDSGRRQYQPALAVARPPSTPRAVLIAFFPRGTPGPGGHGRSPGRDLGDERGN